MAIPTESIYSVLDASLHNRQVKRARHLVSKLNQSIFLWVLLITSDLTCTVAAFFAAYWVRFSLNLPFFKLDVVPSLTYYISICLIFTPLWISIFILMGLYRRSSLLGGTTEYDLVFRATSFSFFAVIIFGFLTPDFILARGWLLLAWLFSFLFVSIGRFSVRRIIYALRARGYYMSNTVIVGANDEGYSVASQLLLSKQSGLNLLGFVDNGQQEGARLFKHLFNLGSIDHLDELITTFDVEEVVVVTSALPREQIISIFEKYGMDPQINLRLSSGLYEVMTTGLEMGQIAHVPLVRVNKMRQLGMDRTLKFLLDYAITLPVLIFLAPLLLILALLIKIDSPGPIIYRRRVVGKNGREFDAFKFRTMRINGDEILEAHPELKEELARNHKLKEDPRITRIGHFLRQYSLDELPQLINVLKRQMSVVGPRMITPAEVSLYKQWGMNLLTVKPGLTGLWQVSGRSNTTYEERVRLDMQYIRTWTIWSDLYIIWLTIPAVLKKDGAF